MAGNEAGHGANVRNRDLIDVWIEAPRGNRKQVVYEKILSLIDITDEPSKHLKSNIMKCSQLFGLKMANKWQKVGQSRNRLLQNQVYWLDKIIYRINNDSEENTSSDEEQEPPYRSVGRPRVPFEEASKKTKRSANKLQFAVNVVSGSNHSEVSPQIFSFSTAESLALMVDLDISVRGPENKAIVEANKKRIQAEFRAKLSLIVDKPKPGYGSSNDGNTSRIFFHNPQTSSDITGVDRELIEKFAISLGVLASGCAIDMEKFASLLEEARNLYIHLYKWYNMPNTVHKVLVHGCEIIDAFCLPIGELSEDALEARHKEVRKRRLSHTRKRSRTDTNKDLMRVLLLTSNPFISSKKKVSSKKYKKCNEAVQNYLKKQENDDLGIDLGTITNDTAPSKESYSD
ncbi:unnamed protein product [Acanthoscelides obtectus]|uniref:Uncharacterized protein n=1 Tax=Acanthoscelides obtectus TaxID=200917 RepID=A0A9P0P284_ACAOB|nr:unnamed protein product [Acanthoscelides obtectus]CAK1663483.1 hypothetical protein AOBTE_LOCUS23699 [Acanthoscelides obtectus]